MDKLGHVLKESLNILTCDARRLVVRHIRHCRVVLCFTEVYLAFVQEVCFEPDQNSDYSLRRVIINVRFPKVDCCERLLVRDVKAEKNSVRFPIVYLSHVSEPFLPRRVPNRQ